MGCRFIGQSSSISLLKFLTFIKFPIERDSTPHNWLDRFMRRRFDGLMILVNPQAHPPFSHTSHMCPPSRVRRGCAQVFFIILCFCFLFPWYHNHSMYDEFSDSHQILSKSPYVKKCHCLESSYPKIDGNRERKTCHLYSRMFKRFFH